MASFLKEYWVLLGAALTAFWGLGTVLMFGAWALYGEDIIEGVRSELGIDELQAMVREATGANRVIRQPEGQTFVREPVRVGEPLVLVLTIARTDLGAACTYVSAVPIFTDAFGSKSAGQFKGAGRQYGTDLVRTEMRIRPPESLIPGRTTLEVQLEYRCGERTIYELTYPVVFTLLAAD